jgi:hypothetical protein
MLRLRRLRRKPAEPVLSHDHSRDRDGWMDEPRLLDPISPYMVRTAAEIALMSDERRAILTTESECRNGWPCRWDPLIDAVGGWEAFQKLVAGLIENVRPGLGVDTQLRHLEYELDLAGFTVTAD